MASGERAESQEVGVDRLLTFSDGIFAIAVTLLVLDIRVPTVSHGLLSAVEQQWPEYLSYVLSFLTVGVIWSHNHLMFRFIRRTDHLFILINVIFLMWVAVVPVPTGILARYLQNGGERPAAIAIYTGIFALGGVLTNLKWHYAIRRRRLLEETVTDAKIRTLTWNYATVPIFYILDFALSFVSPMLSLVLIFVISFFYAVSPLLGHVLSTGSRSTPGGAKAGHGPT